MRNGQSTVTSDNARTLGCGWGSGAHWRDHRILVNSNKTLLSYRKRQGGARRLRRRNRQGSFGAAAGDCRIGGKSRATHAHVAVRQAPSAEPNDARPRVSSLLSCRAFAVSRCGTNPLSQRSATCLTRRTNFEADGSHLLAEPDPRV